MTAEDRMGAALRKVLWGFALAVIALLALAIFVATNAFAEDHRGHTHAGAVGQFYQNWMRPDNRAISCCHDKDCAPAQSKLVNGSWYGRNSDDEEWLKIPTSRIETDRDSPDGQSHLCKAGTTGNVQVYCFLPAGSS